MSGINEKTLRHVLFDLGPDWENEISLLIRQLNPEGITCGQVGQKWPEEPETGTLVLTDKPETVRVMAKCGIPCFGCAKDGKWFDDTILVLESLEGIDGDYLEEWMRRALDLPAPIASTKRLKIREIAREDFDDLIRIYYQQGMSDREGEETFTREGLTAYIRIAYRLQGYGLWSVLYKGKVIGCCGFAPGTSFLELQYMVDEAYQRKGFGTEMCVAAVSYAQRRLGAEKIAVRIQTGNTASLALAEKLGLPVV